MLRPSALYYFTTREEDLTVGKLSAQIELTSLMAPPAVSCNSVGRRSFPSLDVNWILSRRNN